ncbi:carbohydrate ABC transporter permease [Fundicoccus culcitae]|uniref:Carbohydrate ABC transporter permease n=1 Tax=Fundicoccus culcitae TaxID=2969821 RepID=A0ABY5P8B9_9LACT|nr:carbohydrate ABC transporter permease [Fundicoccus culcitae]UUX34987.1 carbohydrate ABC transporter permease [Fundicoccus culcitae]
MASIETKHRFNVSRPKNKSGQSRLNKFLFGNNQRVGFLRKFFTYVLLIAIGFCFILPLLYMVSMSFKNMGDLINSSVNWLPTEWYTENFRRAYEVLDYARTLGQTIIVAVLPSMAQTAVAALVGYGFGRYRFPGHKILLGLVLATFLVPSQVTVIPTYILFNRLGILGSILAYIIPAGLGQGINSAIFILIFYQNFRNIPTSLIEAARLDGANEFTIFTRVAIPMATSAFIISFLFSLVWYWNETYLASIYFGDSLTTLQLELQRFVSSYNSMFPAGQNVDGLGGINEAIELAATLLSILPLLVIYFIAQRWFVDSVDKSGITGE